MRGISLHPALTLGRSVSRRKARFIFSIHHGNYDPKHSCQHRFISATRALSRFCSIHSTCRHQDQVPYNQVCTERYHASNWQSIKDLILFMLISHLSKQTLLLRYLIYLWALIPDPVRCRTGDLLFTWVLELKSTVPMYVFRFSSSESFAQALHGPVAKPDHGIVS